MKNLGFQKIHYWNTGGALVNTTVTTVPQTSSTWSTSRATSTTFTTLKSVPYTSWNTSTTFNTNVGRSQSTSRSTSRSTYYWGSRNTSKSASTTRVTSYNTSRTTSWTTGSQYTGSRSTSRVETYNTSVSVTEYYQTNRFTSGSGGGGFRCVVEGTTITKADGTEDLVENIVTGDSLMSIRGEFNTHDPHILHNFSQYNIVPFIKEPTNVIVNELFVEDKIHNFNNGLLLTTKHHYHVFKRDGVWMIRPSYYMKVGDIFVNKDGAEIEITSIEEMPGNYNVYNLDTEPGDVFFANGILTHNQLHQHTYD